MKLAFLTFLALVLNVNCELESYVSRTLVLSGTDIVNYVLLGNETITKCNLIIYDYNGSNSTSFTLDLQSKKALDTDGIHINSLGQGLCGIRLLNFNKAYPKVYAFEVEYQDTDGTVQKKTLEFRAALIEFKYPDKTKFVRIGAELSVSCDILTVNGYSGLDWQLINPQGQKIISGYRGQYSTAKASFPDYGIWKCSTIIPNTMEPLTFEIEVKVDKDEKRKIVTWYKETGDIATIGCKSLTDTFKTCYFTRPDDKMLAITRNGAVSERYTFIGTNFEDHTCQIEFKLPLLDEERGRWKCDLLKTGGFIDVKATGSLISDYVKHISKRVKLNSNVYIFCKVPYSSDDCYIQAPNGTMYPGGDYDNFQEGECLFNFFIKTPEEAGEWSCHFSKPNSAVDDVVTVELSLYNSVTSKYSEVEVDESDSAQLMCSSVEAIRYCKFVSPNGISFHVSPDKQSSDFHYVGRGLEYGDCGIKIDSVKAEHQGSWSCFVKGVLPSSGKDQEIEFNTTSRIAVNPASGVTTASSIGIPIGVMLVAVILLVGAVIYRHTKRSSYVNESPPNSLESNSSNTSVPIVAGTTLNAVYSPNPFDS